MIDTGSNRFLFAKELDTILLNELYENDWDYAETVFEDCLTHFPEFFAEIEKSFNKKDISQLRKNVHKCKTLLGFVGLSKVQDLYLSFEKLCERAKAIAELEGPYHLLKKETESGIRIVSAELERLKAFNEKQS